MSALARGWVQGQKLRAPDAAVNNDFGNSVAISADGRVALVGSLGVNLSQGAAYVFVRQRRGWRLRQELHAANAAGTDDFGSSVALSAGGRVAVIGAPNKNNRVGATYVFVRTGRRWRQKQELHTPARAGQFGNALALSDAGDVVLIGSWFANGGFFSATGAGYVLTRVKGRWREQQELDASDAAVGDGFGTSVALSPDGGTAVVGTPYPNVGTGAAYVFSRRGSPVVPGPEANGG